MSLTLLYHPAFLLHQTGLHPESPQRLKAVRAFLEREGLLSHLKEVEPHQATEEELGLVHTERHISAIKEFAEKGGGYIDSDTVVSSSSFLAASYACGAAIDAVEEILQNREDVFCLVRPPGHHALTDRAMGFCLFNNLAVAASYALRKKGIDRILIVDWDAHHGNGLQDVFYESDSVLYISFHQFPLYPGTGSIEEVGRKEGEGYTINIPFPAGTGESSYLKAFDEVVLPISEQFQPQMTMVAAGYDSHIKDPLSSLCLRSKSFGKMTALLKAASPSPLIFCLEGGYHLEALPLSVATTIAEVTSLELELPEEQAPTRKERDALETIEEVKRMQKDYWSL